MYSPSDLSAFGTLVKDPTWSPEKFDTLLSKFKSLDGLIALAIMNDCNTDVYKYLIDKGYSVDKPWLNHTPLYYAIKLDRNDLLDRLIAAGANYKSVFHKYMGSLNEPKIIKNLLLKHPDLVNTKNRYGHSGLHIAAWFGNIEIGRILVSSGADTMILNEYGQTALEYCCNKIYYEGRGYDLSTKDRRGREEIVRLLEEEERVYLMYKGFTFYDKIKFNNDHFGAPISQTFLGSWKVKEILEWVWSRSNYDVFGELMGYLV